VESENGDVGRLERAINLAFTDDEVVELTSQDDSGVSNEFQTADERMSNAFALSDENVLKVGLKFHEFLSKTTMPEIIVVSEKDIGFLDLKGCERGSVTGLRKLEGIQER